MSSTPLVSVILPTYNRARLLPRAIESVLSQDYRNLELIVVDDGSTDDTPIVVAGMTDPRLQYVRLPKNRGCWAARNQGLIRAKGHLIALIDADDLWLPAKLRYQVGLLDRHPRIDLVFADYLNLNHIYGTVEKGFYQGRCGLLKLKVKELDDGAFEIMDGLPQALLTANFIATPSVVLLRSTLSRIGTFAVSLRGAGDLEFWWRAAVERATFGYTTRPLIKRHKDQESITANTITFSSCRLQALDLCEATARKAHRDDLLKHLALARHKTWRNLVREYALLGCRGEAARAFLRSLAFGCSCRAWLYLAAALAGPKAITFGKRLRTSCARGTI